MKHALKKYSEFLEEHGYTDSDWRDEKPTAIDRFVAEYKNLPIDKLVRRRCPVCGEPKPLRRRDGN